MSQEDLDRASGIRWSIALPLAVSAVVLVGCGGGEVSDEDQARDTVEQFQEAAAARDGQAFCDLLVEDLSTGVFGCSPGKKAHVLGDAEIEGVAITGSEARVRLDTGFVHLQREGEDWRVDDWYYRFP
jgi:hypothetical protein